MFEFDDDLDDDGHEFGALDAGTAYALLRHGQDRQADRIIDGLRQTAFGQESPEVHVHLHDDEEPIQPVNALDFSTVDMPTDWDDYIGQEPMKQQLSVYMNAAKVNGTAFPHTLFASGYPGVGKTTIARLIAKRMGVQIFEIVPPFNIHTLVAAARKLDDHDILFIDEIHKLADGGKRGAEILLKVLEDKVAFMPDGSTVQLADITVIGATTDRDKLPEPVIDRFKIKPYFQAYSWPELAAIAVSFAYRHHAGDKIDDQLAVDIAKACRNTPRIIEEMVMAADALATTFGQPPTSAQLLEFLEVEPDGLTRTHIHYLTAMRQYFPRMTKDEEIEYIVGEAAIQQILRETKPGLQRLEGFLLERGLIDRTPRGRRLTDLGIARAEAFIAAGKGAANVA
jgi:Holliday junction DNA helicase RuvB